MSINLNHKKVTCKMGCCVVYTVSFVTILSLEILLINYNLIKFWLKQKGMLTYLKK